MVVTVRCFASLAWCQPDPEAIELPGNARMADVFSRLGLPNDSGALILLDKGPATLDTPLHAGALVELLPIVDGG